VHGAFDRLFPSSHDKFGTADQFCRTNIVHARSGIQYRAREGLTLSTAYNSFGLADRRDGIYSSGKAIMPSNGSLGNRIGQEADLQAKWKPDPAYIAGSRFRAHLPGRVSSQRRPRLGVQLCVPGRHAAVLKRSLWNIPDGIHKVISRHADHCSNTPA
jgi:hypothetical protein